jgi:hypothetical protein
MSVTKTAILNKALTLIGANPVTNIDDDTQNARILNRVYEISLRSILSECKWNFATKRRILAQSAQTLEWYFTGDGEAYVYARPSDVIRIFGTNDDDAIWREEGDLIISDTKGLGVIYVYYLDNPDKYPSSFTEAFIDKLCSDIAYMVVNSASLAETFLKKYEGVSLPKATTENAQIGKQNYIKDDAWLKSMTSNGSFEV